MKRNKKIGNRILLLAMLLLTAGMLFLTGWIKGWFDKPENKDPRISASQGSVYLKRLGIGFRSDASLKLRKGDGLLTGQDASAEASFGSAYLHMRPETDLTLVETKDLTFSLQQGTVFVHCGKKEVTFELAGETIRLEEADALLELDATKGTSLLLFSGSCDREDLICTAELQELTLDTLKDLNALPSQVELCYTREELAEETAGRERARQQEMQEKLAAMLDDSEDALVCTIEIRCDSILENPDKLNREKQPYVPEDGQILKEISVNFEEGDTVLDVLERVCTVGEIPLEYNYTPAYKSYYIEGINHLYEFDCGPASGWTYTVNGAYPNYGCSSFKLSDGDEIRWLYTSDYTSTGIEEKE